MKTYTFTYEHCHGDYSWDELMNPIVDSLEIEAETEEEAEALAEIEAMNILKKLSDSLADEGDYDLRTALRNGSPFATNSIKVY